MRTCGSLCLCVALAALLGSSTGCLSLGGKTYVQDSPETEARLKALETRVGALEQSFQTVTNPGTIYVPPPQG